jgi:ATP synthase subunit 6
LISTVLAAACDKGDPGYCAPSTGAFHLPDLFGFDLFGVHFGFTKFTLLLLLGVAVICAFFLASVRKPTLVPSKTQWLGESAYRIIRDGVARDTIGPEGLKFAPYLASLFFFVLIMNVYGILPLAQIPVSSHIAYPMFLAIISLILFNWVGIRKHGAARYFGMIAFPPGVPKAMYLILTPIEVISTLIVRPFTLAVRLFANMFAGHLLLLVFITGTSYLLNVGNFSAVFSPLSFVMAIVMTFFELFVEMLQAYVFVVLTASYISGALVEEH